MDVIMGASNSTVLFSWLYVTCCFFVGSPCNLKSIF